jgi:hypothetical protein
LRGAFFVPPVFLTRPAVLALKKLGAAQCIHFPDCQLTETPAKNEIGEVMGVQLKFRATPNSAGATDLIVSRVLLGFA